MTEVRVARRDDVAAVARIEVLAAAHPWSAAQVESHLDQPGGHGLVATAGDVVVGHVLFQAVCDEVEIHTIAVHPEHQRRGIARHLLKRFDEVAVEQGCASAWLEVRRDNEPARGAYASSGWASCGTRSRYYRDGCDALLFRKELP